MSRLLIIGLVLGTLVAQNRTVGHVALSKNAPQSVLSSTNRTINKKLLINSDTSGMSAVGGADSIVVQSFMETTNEPVTAQYLLKTTRWGDTLAAFQNAYRAVLPVPFELFMPLDIAPESPFPSIVPKVFNDSIYPFKIVPFKTDQRLSGITTFDLALMSRHVLGLEVFNSPYKKVAADVNKDGSIDGTDILLIRRLILRVDTVFRYTPAWVFIPKTYKLPQNAPRLDSIPQAYYFNAFTPNLPNPFQFTLVKMGDVNNSFHDTTTLPAALTFRGMPNSLVLNSENINLEKGKSYEIALNCAEMSQFVTLQGTFSFDTEGNTSPNTQGVSPRSNRPLSANPVSLTSETLTDFNEQNINIINNKISFSWNDAVNKNFKADETVFKLKFTAKTDGRLSDVLKLTDEVTENIVYTEGGEASKLVLHFSEPSKDFRVHQNQPNPFVTETTVKIEILNEKEAQTRTKYTVFDETGHLVFENTQLFKSGIHLLRLNVNEMGLSKAGIYFLKVETPTGQQTIKLLKISY